MQKHRLSMVGTTRSQVIPLMPLQVILYLEAIPRLVPNSVDFANCSAFSIIEEPKIQMEHAKLGIC